MNRSSSSGRRILFWSEQFDVGHAALFSGLFKLFGQPQHLPKDFVRNDIPYDDRRCLADALELRSTMHPNGGQVLTSYFGWAECRICGVKLGSRDLFGHGFVWPEKAEHYILNHNVWTPDCDALLTAVRMRK